MYSISRQHIDFSLCANCSKIGSIEEVDIISSGGSNFSINVLKTKVVDALEFLYGISWVDFTDKFEKCNKSENNDYFGVTDNKLLNNVTLCKTCASLVAESYRFQKNLESLSHSKSLLQLAKRICGCRPPDNNFVDYLQNNSINDNETFEELIVVNQQDADAVDNNSVNDFPFDDRGSEVDGFRYTGNNDDDIEIKYVPVSDFGDRPNPTDHVKLKDLRIALHKIPKHILQSVLRKKATGTNKNISSKSKNTKPAKQKKCLEKLRPRATSTRLKRRKPAGGSVQRFEDLNGDEKVLKVDKTEKVKLRKRKRKSPKNENDSPRDDLENKESDLNTSTKKKRQKEVKPKPELEEFSKTYECRICHEFFSKSYLLTRHRRTHNIHRPLKPENPAKPYTCDVCERVCPNFNAYKRHFRVRHKETHKISCHICGKIFKEGYLKAHLKLIHADEEEKEKKKTECQICGKILPKATLPVHMKIHSEDREKFVCEHCGNVYWKKENYNRHMLSHNSDLSAPFSCKFCQKPFYGKYALERHERRHNKDGKKPFACDMCEKSFNENYMLVRHKVKHQEDRPFNCDLCGKGFKSSEYLIMHQKGTHAKIRKVNDFPCLICGMKFLTKKKLGAHATFHNITEENRDDENGNNQLIILGTHDTPSNITYECETVTVITDENFITCS